MKKKFGYDSTLSGVKNLDEQRDTVSDKIKQLVTVLGSVTAFLSFSAYMHTTGPQEYLSEKTTGHKPTVEQLVTNDKISSDLLSYSTISLAALVSTIGTSAALDAKEKNRKLKPGYKVIGLETSYGLIYLEVPEGSMLARRNDDKQELYYIMVKSDATSYPLHRFAVNSKMALQLNNGTPPDTEELNLDSENKFDNYSFMKL